jgi:hypothetical protein
MWIVKNLLKGTLTFKGLGISIPPKQEFDLDVLGREQAEKSNQIMVAFEEGYIQNIHKESLEGGPSKQITRADFDRRLQRFKTAIVEELRETLLGANPSTEKGEKEVTKQLSELRSSIVGDVKALLENLKVAKLKLKEEKERLLVDDSLSEAEIKARIVFLEEKEKELEKNFEKIGKKSASTGEGDIFDKADLLSNM